MHCDAAVFLVLKCHCAHPYGCFVFFMPEFGGSFCVFNVLPYRVAMYEYMCARAILTHTHTRDDTKKIFTTNIAFNHFTWKKNKNTHTIRGSNNWFLKEEEKKHTHTKNSCIQRTNKCKRNRQRKEDTEKESEQAKNVTIKTKCECIHFYL